MLSIAHHVLCYVFCRMCAIVDGAFDCRNDMAHLVVLQVEECDNIVAVQNLH